MNLSGRGQKVLACFEIQKDVAAAFIERAERQR